MWKLHIQTLADNKSEKILSISSEFEHHQTNCLVIRKYGPPKIERNTKTHTFPPTVAIKSNIDAGIRFIMLLWYDIRSTEHRERELKYL